MDLMTALNQVERNHVVYFRDDSGAVHVCLAYGTGPDGILIAAPDVGKHWEPLNDKRLSNVLQDGRPVFADG